MTNEAPWLHVSASPTMPGANLPRLFELYCEIPRSKRGLVDSFLKTSIGAIFFFATHSFQGDFKIIRAEISQEFPNQGENIHKADLIKTFGRLLR